MKLKHVNWERIKEIVCSQGFMAIMGTVAGIAMTAAFAYETAKMEKTQQKKEELQQDIGNIGYAFEDKQFSLDELYVVKKNDIDYLCSRTEVGKTGGIPLLLQQQYLIQTGILIPSVKKDIYVYCCIKTNEIICSSQDNDVTISKLTVDLAEEVIDGNLKKEEINKEYIDNQFKQNVK